MNQQERDRILASLTDDEIQQLRDRLSDAPATGAHDAADREFARKLLGGGDD